MNKPEVLSNGKILEIWGNPNFTERDGRTVQRDADVAYYEPLIQQARQEIFEEIERHYSYLGDCGVGIDNILSDEWQSFKSKYIGGQK